MLAPVRFAALLGLLAGPGCEGRPVFEEAEWVTIPAGAFDMGSPPTETCRESGKFKETLHRVTLTRSFQISTTEVTQGQFEDRLKYNPSNFVECGADCPVDGVSWSEAAAYCNTLSLRDEVQPCYTCGGAQEQVYCEAAPAFAGSKIYLCPGYRLPTEAEWEHACRAGTKTALYTGNLVECSGYDPNAVAAAWYFANGGQTVHQVKGRAANPWGLHDMPGNVWEWVNDWYEGDLGSAAVTDPVGAPTETLGRMLRGGSAEVAAHLVRAASRHNYAPPGSAYRLKYHGFRCVRRPKS